jgi:hypothetical protein
VVPHPAARSASLTPERLEELATHPAPLPGGARGAAAAARLLAMASHLSGRQ